MIVFTVATPTLRTPPCSPTPTPARTSSRSTSSLPTPRTSSSPCFVLPETANQDFARGSKIHSEFVNPYVPDTVCFENLILDELVLFPGMSAKLVDLRSALLRNPFIVCDDPTALLSVRQ